MRLLESISYIHVLYILCCKLHVQYNASNNFFFNLHVHNNFHCVSMIIIINGSYNDVESQ